MIIKLVIRKKQSNAGATGNCADAEDSQLITDEVRVEDAVIENAHDESQPP